MRPSTGLSTLAVRAALSILISGVFPEASSLWISHPAAHRSRWTSRYSTLQRMHSSHRASMSDQRVPVPTCNTQKQLFSALKKGKRYQRWEEVIILSKSLYSSPRQTCAFFTNVMPFQNVKANRAIVNILMVLCFFNFPKTHVQVN